MIRIEDTFSECKHCNSKFRVANSKHEFCSKICYRRAYYKANTEAVKASSDKYKKENPLVAKNIKLKRYYGISIEEYLKMNTDQCGKCKICDNVCPTGRELSVDHCHKTGKIRGLLCANCNIGLGAFKDNTDRLKLAIKYLGESGDN